MKTILAFLTSTSTLTLTLTSTLTCPELRAQKPALHQVRVDPDGSFTPRYIHLNALDTVEWLFSNRNQSVAPITLADSLSLQCDQFKPRVFADPNDFTGPAASLMPGIVALSPDGPGFEILSTGQNCPQNLLKAAAGNQFLCERGPDYATMDWTWKNPNITGVFIRLRWDEVHLGPGKYDWTFLDREITKAVENGKMYSLGFKAGLTGTPAWIFNPSVAGNFTVKKLRLRDNEDEETCGTPGDMGSPSDIHYRKWYFDLWRDVAAHIKEKNAWYRALGYVKPSGMNLFTHENRLPKNCKDGCEVCNPEVWAKGGYTPNALYDFYTQQFNLLDTLFPDKYMQYALIQAGFPLVNNKGEYTAPFTEPLPDGTEQTEKIMALGRTQHGLKFIVSHNGLGPRPQDGNQPLAPCPNEGKHPAVRPFAQAATRCPNPYALREGEAGQITGWQSQNARTVNSPETMESTLRNAWDNSDGIYLEFYEERIWEAETAGPVLDPKGTGRTLRQWDSLLHQRVKSFWGTKVEDPFPLKHRQVFKRTTANKNEAQVFYYVNPQSCKNGTKSFGVITLRAESSVPYGTEPEEEEQIQLALYPNPGIGPTFFRYFLPRPVEVRLEVYDPLGRRIAGLVRDTRPSGWNEYIWPDNFQLAPGTYMVRLNAGKQTLTRRLMLMR